MNILRLLLKHMISIVFNINPNQKDKVFFNQYNHKIGLLMIKKILK